MENAVTFAEIQRLRERLQKHRDEDPRSMYLAGALAALEVLLPESWRAMAAPRE